MADTRKKIHNITVPLIDLLLCAVIGLVCCAFCGAKSDFAISAVIITAVIFMLRLILGVYKNPELPFNKLSLLKSLISDSVGVLISVLVSVNSETGKDAGLAVVFAVGFAAVSLIVRILYKKALSKKTDSEKIPEADNTDNGLITELASRENKISVVIATYRRDETLTRAISSVLSQDYDNYEIVVVDDNADSEWNLKVKSIVEGFEEAYKKGILKLIVNKENLGSAKTRNVGVFACEGEYITFLDDDDIYLPGKLTHQLSGMLHTGADFSITDLKLYDENDNLHDERIRKNLVSYEKQDLLRYHLMYHLTGTDSLMFRSEYIRKIGAFPPINIGDEFYLMLQAILGGGRLCYVKGCYIKAYIHVGDGGLSSGQVKIDGERELFRYKQQFFPELDKKSRRHIKMRHHAVVAFAYLRINDYAHFVIEGFKAVASAPLEAVELLRNL